MFSFDAIRENKTNFPNIYLGVVEEDNDPNKAGRVRVRILGLHSDIKKQSEVEGIPIDELPWAIPALPAFEGGTSGLGIFSVPVKGSWVALFMIGGDHNYPVYFANIAAFPKTKPDSSKGFTDPSGKYPTKTGEPDWNSNARNAGELIKDTKDGKVETGISQYKADAWDEPNSPYATVYPNNNVIECRDKGIVIEMDSTPGAERYHIYHKASGNYFEIGPDGQTVYKSYGNNFEINIQGKNIFVKENSNIHIEEDCDQNIVGDSNTQIGGNSDIMIEGNSMYNVDGKDTLIVGGDRSEDITGKETRTVTGDVYETLSSKLTINVTGEVQINSNAKTKIKGSSGVDIDGGTGATYKVVNTNSICPFIGMPHPDGSTNVKCSY